MLHILLTILKVIGIILLVILALILAVILILLFVPVRYRFHVRKEDGPVEADGMLSWFLRLIRVNITYRGKQGQAELRILGFRLKSFRIPAGEDGTQNHAAPVKTESKQTAPADPVPMDVSSKEPVQEPEKTESYLRVEHPLKEESRPDGNLYEERRADESRSDEKRTKVNRKEESGTEEGRKEENSASKEDSSSKIRAVLDALPARTVRLIERICNLLLRLIDLPFDAYDKIDSTADRVGKKISAIRDKMDPFLSIEADHMLRKMIRHLMYLANAWKPRRVEGYLEFGTGRPDLTGELAGLICLLLPASARRFELKPDFYEKVLRADVKISGRIRLWRLAVVGFRLLIDKEFWELVRLIRKKPPKKGRRAKRHRR